MSAAARGWCGPRASAAVGAKRPMAGREGGLGTRRRAATILLIAAGAGIAWLGHQADWLLLLLFGGQVAVLGVCLAIRRAVYASVLVLSFLFAVTAAEFFLSTERMLNALTRYGGDFTSGYYAGSDLGVQGRPGVHTARKLLRIGGTIFDVKYTIGADGFRVTPAPAPAPPSAPTAGRRINFFGCSYMFGEGVNDDETLPYFVAKYGGFAVKNYAFQGYGPHQALAILQSGRDTAGAVNFFLTVPWHAPRAACVPEWTAHSPRYVLDGGKAVRAGTCRETPAAARGFFATLADGSMIVEVLDDLLHRGRSQDRQLDLHIALIGEMQEISLRRGQELVVGYLRTRDGWFAGSYTNDRFIAALQRKGIRVIDLTLGESLFDLDGRHVIHLLDAHPSRAANAERAKRVVEFLREMR